MPASEASPPPPPTKELTLTRPHHVGLTVGLAIAHALLFVASFPGLGLWPLMFLAVAAITWLAIGAATTRLAVMIVFFAQWAMWLWLSRWIIDVTFVGYPLLAMYLAFYGAAFVWLIRSLRLHPMISRWPMTLLAPVVWVGVECLRGNVVMDGYPWYLAAHPMIEAPILAQSADLLGTYFVSFLVVMVAGLIADVLLVRVITRPLMIAAAVTLALHGANLLYGGWRLSQRDVLSAGPAVLAIQTNLPQSNKNLWEPVDQRRDTLEFIDLTYLAFDAAAAADVRPDLLIWPETMLPGFGLEPETIRTLVESGYFPGDWFSKKAELVARRLDVPFLVGSPSYLGLRVADDRWEWDAHYNSAYLIDAGQPHQRYDKVFLTPFGETMPYISKWDWLESKLLAIGAQGMSFALDSAAEPNRLRMEWNTPASSREALTLATPICFEDTVPRVCRRMVYEGADKKVDLLANLSNDGWFGEGDAGRQQHVQIARFRCIENRVPMIRVVNTGVTVALDSAGRIISPLNISPKSGDSVTVRHHGWLLAELPLDSRSTVYGRMGDVWAWLCLLGTIGLGAMTLAARRWGTVP